MLFGLLALTVAAAFAVSAEHTLVDIALVFPTVHRASSRNSQNSDQ